MHCMGGNVYKFTMDSYDLDAGGRVFPYKYNFSAVGPTWYLSLRRNQGDTV